MQAAFVPGTDHRERSAGAFRLPDLLAMFRRRGYPFVPLEQALADDAYRLKDDDAGPGGFSWIHRWSKTKGVPPKGEPEPPPWVRAGFAAR